MRRGIQAERVKRVQKPSSRQRRITGQLKSSHTSDHYCLPPPPPPPPPMNPYYYPPYVPPMYYQPPPPPPAAAAPAAPVTRLEAATVRQPDVDTKAILLSKIDELERRQREAEARAAEAEYQLKQTELRKKWEHMHEPASSFEAVQHVASVQQVAVVKQTPRVTTESYPGIGGGQSSRTSLPMYCTSPSASMTKVPLDQNVSQAFSYLKTQQKQTLDLSETDDSDATSSSSSSDSSSAELVAEAPGTVGTTMSHRTDDIDMHGPNLAELTPPSVILPQIPVNVIPEQRPPYMLPPESPRMPARVLPQATTTEYVTHFQPPQHVAVQPQPTISHQHQRVMQRPVMQLPLTQSPVMQQPPPLPAQGPVVQHRSIVERRPHSVAPTTRKQDAVMSPRQSVQHTVSAASSGRVLSAQPSLIHSRSGLVVRPLLPSPISHLASKRPLSSQHRPARSHHKHGEHHYCRGVSDSTSRRVSEIARNITGFNEMQKSYTATPKPDMSSRVLEQRVYYGNGGAPAQYPQAPQRQSVQAPPPAYPTAPPRAYPAQTTRHTQPPYAHNQPPSTHQYVASQHQYVATAPSAAKAVDEFDPPTYYVENEPQMRPTAPAQRTKRGRRRGHKSRSASGSHVQDDELRPFYVRDRAASSAFGDRPPIQPEDFVGSEVTSLSRQSFTIERVPRNSKRICGC